MSWTWETYEIFITHYTIVAYENPYGFARLNIGEVEKKKSSMYGVIKAKFTQELSNSPGI